MQTPVTIRRFPVAFWALGVILSSCVGSQPSPVAPGSATAAALPNAIIFKAISRSESPLGLHVGRITVPQASGGWIDGELDIVVWNDGQKPLEPKAIRVMRAYVDTQEGRTYEATNVCASQADNGQQGCRVLPRDVFLVSLPGARFPELIAPIPKGIPVGVFKLQFRFAQAATPKALVIELDTGDSFALDLSSALRLVPPGHQLDQAYPPDARINSNRSLREFFILEKTGSDHITVNVDYSCVTYGSRFVGDYVPALRYRAVNANKLDQEEVVVRLRSLFPYYNFAFRGLPGQEVAFVRADESRISDTRVILGPGQTGEGKIPLEWRDKVRTPLPSIYVFETVKGDKFENIKVQNCG